MDYADNADYATCSVSSHSIVSILCLVQQLSAGGDHMSCSNLGSTAIDFRATPDSLLPQRATFIDWLIG